MEKFDEDFENERLGMLVSQFPDASNACGEIDFSIGDVDKDGRSESEFRFVGDYDSDFRYFLVNQVEMFSEYRRSHNVAPHKKGVIQFAKGKFIIKWVEG